MPHCLPDAGAQIPRRTVCQTHLYSLIESSTLHTNTKPFSRCNIEVFTAATIKNAVFWDVTPCGSCKILFIRSVLQLVVTADVVSSSMILSNVMVVIRSSEMSTLSRATRRQIPEGGSLHSNRHENFKSFTALTGWAL
jgi:hypothetical protein